MKYRVHLPGNDTIVVEAASVEANFQGVVFRDDAERLVGLFYSPGIVGVSIDTADNQDMPIEPVGTEGGL